MESHQPAQREPANTAVAERQTSLLAETIFSAEQLRDAVARGHRASTRKLGAELLEIGLITVEQLNAALAIQGNDPSRPLGDILVGRNVISTAELQQVLCLRLGIPLVRIGDLRIARDVLRLVPEELIHEHRIVPLCRLERRLVVAVANPLDNGLLDHVRFFAQMPLVPVMAPPQDIDRAIRVHYGPVPDIPYSTGKAEPPGLARSHPTVRSSTPPRNELEPSVTDFARTIVSDAHASGASDIHLDASADGQQLAVRVRREGTLEKYIDVPAHIRAGVVKHIKSLAGVRVTARGRAAEGRIDVQVGGRDLRLRVMVVPTRDGGEHIAIRLLSGNEWPRLESIGMAEPELARTKQLLVPPGGLIIVAGPALTGKTTTAHALLTSGPAGAKIWAVEEGVDSPHPGISQIEIDPAAGWDYTAAMRAVVRADPDVILLGDTVDREAAALAVQAALRGCRVISVVNTASAAAAIDRLLQLGVNAFSLSDALRGVIAQRLARGLCVACRASRPLTSGEIATLVDEYRAGTPLDTIAVRAEWQRRFGEHLLLHSAVGCEACGGSGYTGHVALFEVLAAHADIHQLVRQRHPIEDIVAAAIRGGMRTVGQAGILKALAGECDIREIRAATA